MAAETIAKLRVSRGGLNGPAAVVLRVMTFHIAITWTGDEVATVVCVRESCGATRPTPVSSLLHANTAAHTATMRSTCGTLTATSALILASQR